MKKRLIIKLSLTTLMLIAIVAYGWEVKVETQWSGAHWDDATSSTHEESTGNTLWASTSAPSGGTLHPRGGKLFQTNSTSPIVSWNCPTDGSSCCKETSFASATGVFYYVTAYNSSDAAGGPTISRIRSTGAYCGTP